MTLPDFSQSLEFNTLRDQMGIDQQLSIYCYDCQQWITNASELPAHPGHSIH